MHIKSSEYEELGIRHLFEENTHSRGSPLFPRALDGNKVVRLSSASVAENHLLGLPFTGGYFVLLPSASLSSSSFVLSSLTCLSPWLNILPFQVTKRRWQVWLLWAFFPYFSMAITLQMKFVALLLPKPKESAIANCFGDWKDNRDLSSLLKAMGVRLVNSRGEEVSLVISPNPVVRRKQKLSKELQRLTSILTMRA